MRLGGLLLGAVILAPALASAEVPAGAPGPASPPQRRVVPPGQAELYDVVAGAETVDGYQLGRQLLPASSASTTSTTSSTSSTSLVAGGASAVAASRTVYLNKNGVTLTPGINDARLNRSSLVTQQTTIAPWNVSASTWAATVSCIREIFSPFNITIVETDPGSTVPHIEAVFGGTPAQLGMTSSLAGVSPFLADCAVIENSMVFTFMGSLPAESKLACEIQAQEIAHSYGLDHVLLATDLMTYLPFENRRWFQNQIAPCGEDDQRACGINGSVCRQSQNSVAMLVERVGLKGQAGDTVAPTVAITSPASGATVPPTFDVSFSATDNARVTMVSLYVDGAPSGSVVMAPFKIRTPKTLPEGTHTLRIVATDGNNEQAREITVTVSKSASSSDEEGVTVGCAAGGGGPAGAGPLSVVAALGLLARRRRRRG